MIPPDRERAAVEMFRHIMADPNDIAVERIRKFIWPQGNAAVSVPMLRTLLRSLVAACDVDEASDELPDDLAAALEDLKDSRKKIMDAINSDGGDPETGQPNAMLHSVLVQNVKAHIAASKHQIELQQHRAILEAERRRRTPHTRSGSGKT